MKATRRAGRPRQRIRRVIEIPLHMQIIEGCAAIEIAAPECQLIDLTASSD
jgi:hypothetical protein